MHSIAAVLHSSEVPHDDIKLSLSTRPRALGGGSLKRVLLKISSSLFQALVVVGALVTLFIALTTQGSAGFHTALFLTQVLDMPVKPQTWFTDEPIRHQVSYPAPGGASVAEVYRIPDGKPRATALLSLGVYDEGFDGEIIVNLGNALARAGYVVVYRWSPEMGMGYRIEPSEVQNLVSAFQFLEDQDFVDPDRAGLGGFCVGASFALVAAADPVIRERVHFVNAFGPFFDARDLLVEAASRTVIYDGQATNWEPHELTMRVLANELVKTLEDLGEAELLVAHYASGEQKKITELDGLSLSAQRAIRLLNGVSREQAIELVAELPTGIHEKFASISPVSHVSGISARMLVMHDRDDLLVPAAESRRLLAATGNKDIRYTELFAFDHVAPSGGGIITILGQAARLYRHMYEIIRIAH